MLSDPLTIKGLDLLAHSTITPWGADSYAITDVAPGKSVRQCSVTSVTNGPGTLTISHSVSNENKPAATDRSVVRIDFLCKDINGREMKAYGYAVLGIPRGASFYDDPSSGFIAPVRVVGSLLGFLSGITASALDEARVNRVIAGEP